MDFKQGWQQELGHEPGHLANGRATMDYVVGCILRERERLARVFEHAGMADLAAAIRSGKNDRLVFKWEPPTVGLDEPPRSVSERKAVKDES